MRYLEFVRKEGESLADIEAMLEGRIFHTTRRENWEKIVDSGEIRPNPDGRLPSTFGYAKNSFFRKRGCVSVFDYRMPPDDAIQGFRRKCRPFDPAGEGAGIAILLLKNSVEARLISWEKWKKEEAWGEMIVPHVEAGHPGPIVLSDIEQVVFLYVEEDPNSVAATLRRAIRRR